MLVTCCKSNPHLSIIFQFLLLNYRSSTSLLNIFFSFDTCTNLVWSNVFIKRFHTVIDISILEISKNEVLAIPFSFTAKQLLSHLDNLTYFVIWAILKKFLVANFILFLSYTLTHKKVVHVMGSYKTRSKALPDPRWIYPLAITFKK